MKQLFWALTWFCWSGFLITPRITWFVTTERYTFPLLFTVLTVMSALGFSFGIIFEKLPDKIFQSFCYGFLFIFNCYILCCVYDSWRKKSAPVTSTGQRVR